MIQKQELIIEADTVSRQYWMDLWKYRDLFYFLSLRDFQIRYKQTLVGIAWSVFRPLVTMLVFTFVFNKIGNFESVDMPYPLMALSGLLIWQLFSTIVSESSNSLISNSALITKVYFPRIIIPFSSSLVCLVDFFIGLVIYLVISLFLQQGIDIHLLFMPFPILICLFLALGTGFLLSAVNVMYRDVKYVVSFMLQLGIYVSPVAFASSAVPEKWRTLFYMNPLVGVIEVFRWILTSGKHPVYVPGVVASGLVAFLILAIGIKFFRRVEKKFADVI